MQTQKLVWIVGCGLYFPIKFLVFSQKDDIWWLKKIGLVRFTINVGVRFGENKKSDCKAWGFGTKTQ